jgi:ribosomal-protein-alanine N-acetyltransferase
MITNYIDNYYEYLKENIKEFNVEYLKKENPFLKNYVYLENNEPIGLISYSLIYDRIELEYIWTSFEHRKKGIASKLMDKMLEEKVNNITLEVRTTNEGAINLYKKYNFKIVSTRKNYYGNEDAYLMIREMM